MHEVFTLELDIVIYMHKAMCHCSLIAWPYKFLKFCPANLITHIHPSSVPLTLVPTVISKSGTTPCELGTE